MCGSGSEFGIRIWIQIQEAPEYGSNMDPDPQHLPKLYFFVALSLSRSYKSGRVSSSVIFWATELPEPGTNSEGTELDGKGAGDTILEELEHKYRYLSLALTVQGLSSTGRGLEMQFLKSWSISTVPIYSFLYSGKCSMYTETLTNNSYNPSPKGFFRASLVRGTFWDVYVSLTWTNGAPDV